LEYESSLKLEISLHILPDIEPIVSSQELMKFEVTIKLNEVRWDFGFLVVIS
jgi:hypothetical protein